jgi:hypothetical protein
LGLSHTAGDPERIARRIAAARVVPEATERKVRTDMHSIDAHDVAVAQRGAEQECQAIAADLERLKALFAEAGDRLLASFNVVAVLTPRLAVSDGDRHELGTAIASAVTALQFQDMASQLTAHAQRRLAVLQDVLARLSDDADPLLASTRLQPVKQAGMGAGSIDLF